MRREQLALASWWSEVLCVILTLIYSCLALSDIRAGVAYWSSASWFQEGFCIWRGEYGLDSHTLCFVFDVPWGIGLAAYNYKLYRSHSKGGVLLPAIAISLFNALHGWAHWMIHLYPEEQPQPDTLSTWILASIGMFVFLALGPFLGAHFGVSGRICLIVHAALSFVLPGLPQKFGFGILQGVLNCWYCVPRLLNIGCESPGDIEKRVDNGWAISSFAGLLLMPVVFAEMMGCESFYQSMFGHFLYDLSILVYTFLYSATLWQELPQNVQEEKGVNPQQRQQQQRRQEDTAQGLPPSKSNHSGVRKRAESPAPSASK